MTGAVGLIGIGLLGEAMAERLLKSGFEVIGFDVDAGKRKTFGDRGGTPVESPASVALACRRILLSLPNSAIVKGVLDEIRPALTEGTVVVDTTTGDPREIEKYGPMLESWGVRYLDATVGGSSREAKARDVIVMVGGHEEDFALCQDIFDVFARQAFHVGPWGSGSRMKLVTNLVLGLHRAVLAEALAFAEASGLDAGMSLEILKASSSYSRVMDIKGGKMLKRDFQPDARLAQHIKDVRLMLANGDAEGAFLPLSRLHLELLESLEKSGFGELDNSVVLRAFLKEKLD